MADRLDRGVIPELLAQAAHRDFDDVGTWIEVVAPHLREQPLATDHFTGVQGELSQQPELAVREVSDVFADSHLPA
jgi:hypothetical protein